MTNKKETPKWITISLFIFLAFSAGLRALKRDKR